MERKDIVKAVKKAKKGDKQATSLLYEQTHNQIYFLILKLLSGKEQDALDIVQDSYIKAFSSLNTLKDDGSFVSWLKSIAINQARNFLKKQGGLAVTDDEALEQVEELAEDFIPHEYMESVEKRQIVAGIIDRLPDAQRTVILLYYYENMQISLIAAVMECSESTIKSRLNYAKAKIKKEVEALEKNGTNLLGVAAMPILSQILRSVSEDCVIPKVVSEQILANTLSSTAVTSSIAGAGSISIGGKIMAMSVGVKAAVAVGGAAIVLTAGIGIPVYISNENQKAVQAALILQQEQEEQAARRYELNAMKTALEAVSSEWSENAISSAKLVSLAGEFTKLNAFLLVEGDIDNIDDIKAAVEEADKIIVTLDYADPATISDLDADVKLSELRESIGTAIEALGLEDAVCVVDRIEVAQASVSGTVGDIMSIQTTIYPTMVRSSAVLAWSSSDATIVDIDTDSGEMALLKDGTCTVKAIELGSGKEVTVTIVVAKKTVAGADWYTADNADQFTSQAPAQGSGSQAANGGQQAQPTPPNGDKEVKAGDLTPGTKLPGGVIIKDEFGDFDDSLANHN